ARARRARVARRRGTSARRDRSCAGNTCRDARTRRLPGAREGVAVSRAPAPAKINLALVVGPLRDDGKHEVLTVLQRIDLVDRIELGEASEFRVEGFVGDTLVGSALSELARAAGVEPRWHVRIEKSIPVAAGLGGGSSDAATALRLANDAL